MTHVVGEEVERTVVGPGLLVQAVEHCERVVEGQLVDSLWWRSGGEEPARTIVLSDEVSTQRMQRPGHVTRQEEVEHRVPSPVLDDQGVEGQLYEPVERDPARRGLLTDKAGTESVEEDLEGAVSNVDGGKEGLARRRRGEGEGETDAKKALPRTVLRTRSSKWVGRSVSMPSSPRNWKRRETKVNSAQSTATPCSQLHSTSRSNHED